MMKGKVTARQKLVAALSSEILQDPRELPYLIASENQLCRRFQVSRVTVRLALSDLETHGLIYRQHGKGTFAHGRNGLVGRPIGILLKSTQAMETRPVADLIRGAQMALAAQRSALILLCTSPEQWLPSVTSSLSGVLVLPHDILEPDLENLRERKLPFLFGCESTHPGPKIQLGQKEAARQVTAQLLSLGHRRLALITGYDHILDAPKRRGIDEALQSAGLDPAGLLEITAQARMEDMYAAARQLLDLRPRPTAIIAMDDSLAAMVNLVVRQQGLRLPQDISLVSFHQWSYLDYVEPVLNTVHFDFYAAGQQAVQSLTQAASLGAPISEISLPYRVREGGSVGPAPQSA